MNTHVVIDFNGRVLCHGDELDCVLFVNRSGRTDLRIWTRAKLEEAVW